MMKKFVFAAGVLLLWPGLIFAGTQNTVTLPADAYQAILERLDALQNRVKALEQEKKTAVSAPVGHKDNNTLSKDIDQIYDTLDVVETKTLSDRINLGAELRVRVDNYKLTDSDFSFNTATGAILPSQAQVYDDNNWKNRFRLNMDARINSTLAFHGRMTVYQNWGDSDITTNSLYNAMNSAHRPGSSAVYLDRAYIDWIPDFVLPIAVTVGRHPSTEGPPFELKENRKRQATYPALLFDAENDGIVVTLGLERYIGLKNSGWRFAYGKGYHSDDDNNSGFSFFNDGNAGDANMYATFFESEIPGLNNSLAVLTYAHITDIPSSFLGIDSPVNLGNMDLYGIHLQANHFLDSPFDIFVSWGGNTTDPNGAYVDYSGFFGFPMTMGLLSADGNEDHSGSSIYAGLRYTAPFSPLNNPKIGFEYNHGSKYWMSMTMAGAEMFNKLATRGDAYEVYYIQPVNKYLFFRAGYIYINYDYTGSGSHLGAPQPSNAELSDYYFLMDCHF